MFTVKISRNPLELSFEAGTVDEATAALEKAAESLKKFFAVQIQVGDQEQNEPAAATETPAKRGRKPKNQPDPASASAPPPAPVPSATPDNLTIPPFLDRTGGAAAAPPPPPVPVPPPAPPQVGGVLATKIIAELQKRANGSADQGAGLATWLAQAGTVVPGATFAEAIEVIRVSKDEKLTGIAGALSLS